MLDILEIEIQKYYVRFTSHLFTSEIEDALNDGSRFCSGEIWNKKKEQTRLLRLYVTVSIWTFISKWSEV
jgi:hypothetical protein